MLHNANDNSNDGSEVNNAAPPRRSSSSSSFAVGGNDPVVVKMLKQGVASVIRGEVPQELRRMNCGSLRSLAVSTQNSPVTREFLGNEPHGCLAYSSFVHSAVAFLPVQCLANKANVLLQRNTSDPTGMYRCIYAYAMLLFMDACRRGTSCSSWVGTHKGEAVIVQNKADVVMVMQCCYDNNGDLKGWLIFNYGNIKPPDAPSAFKTSRRPREESFHTVYERAQDALRTRGEREMERVLAEAGSEVAGRVRQRIMTESLVKKNTRAQSWVSPFANSCSRVSYRVAWICAVPWRTCSVIWRPWRARLMAAKGKRPPSRWRWKLPKCANDNPAHKRSLTA